MVRNLWVFTLAAQIISGPISAGEPSAPNTVTSTSALPTVRVWEPNPFPAVILQDPFTTSNGTEGEDSRAQAPAKEGPFHIRDNAFLVEEAFNQEKGDVQHIFNWLNLWNRVPGGKSRNFAFTYTMELPLGSQAHQFSFATVFLTLFDKPRGGPAEQVGDVSDTFLNYRYQLLADDDFLWCSPRFTLIAPTGDRRLGTGTGEWGYQFNLPISRYGDRFDFHFNAGYTFIPHVTAFLPDESMSPRHDLRAYNLGASMFWKPQVYLHFFVEVFALSFEEIDDLGLRNRNNQAFINPGVRYAVIQDPVEWVLGVSVPIGITPDTPEIGVFAYMSIEHTFRKKKNGEAE